MSGDLEVVRKALHDRHYVCCEHNRSYPCNCGLGLALAALSRLEAQQPTEHERLYGGTPQMDWDADFYVRITDGRVVSYHSATCQQIVEKHTCAGRCPACGQEPTGEQPTPPECPACAQAQRELERRTETLHLAVRLKLQAQAKNDALTREVEKLLEFVRKIAGPVRCSGLGPREDDNGKPYSESDQELIDRLHVKNCRLCHAAALLVEHEKEQG